LKTQASLCIVAAFLLSLWAVGVILNLSFGGYIHIILGSALAIIIEIIALIFSHQSAKRRAKQAISSVSDQVEERRSITVPPEEK
jgi:hypothetical protein